jgi:hypothetical protein
MASAAPRLNDADLARCEQVIGEFERFERPHDVYKQAAHAAVGNTFSPAYRPDEGE